MPLVIRAAEKLEITAPGGAEVDLATNVMKYHSLNLQLVEVLWDNFFLETKYLEYNRVQSIFNRQRICQSYSKIAKP